MRLFRHRRRSIPRLPLEICETIIEFVGLPSFDRPSWQGEARRKTLFSCLLVCKDWVPRSRVHLCECVKLDGKRKAASFMEAMTQFPFLGKYVQGLTIEPNYQHDDWIYKVHQVLPQHLPNLSHLGYHTLPAVHHLFFTISARFNFVKVLSLEGLESWSLQEITRLLNRFPRLEKLMISPLDWDMIPRFGSLYCRNIGGRNAVPPRLMVLHIHTADLCGNSDNSLFHWLARSRWYHSLHALSLTWDVLCHATSSHYLDDFLLQCAVSLEYVMLSLPNTDDHIPGRTCE